MLIFGTQYHYSAKTKNGIELGNNLVVTTPAGYTISGNNISEKKLSSSRVPSMTCGWAAPASPLSTGMIFSVTARQATTH